MLNDTHKITTQDGKTFVLGEVVRTVGNYRVDYNAVMTDAKDPEVLVSMLLTIYDKAALRSQKLENMSANDATYYRNQPDAYVYGSDDITSDCRHEGDGLDNLTIIARPRIDAPTLRAYLDSHDIDRASATALIEGIAKAVETLYATAGRCHYNLTPDTVRIADNGQVILDNTEFISSDPDMGHAIDRRAIDKGYRAPETVLLGFKQSAMQYSLAMLMVYVMDRRLPWDSPTDAKTKQPVIDAWHNEALRQVMAKALSPKPDKRYRDFREMLNEMRRALDLPVDENAIWTAPAKPVERDAIKAENERTGADERQGVRIDVTMEPIKGDGFKAVAGMGQLKSDLTRDFINIVNNRELAAEFGLNIPGVLMYGPPGTGKTYIAERLAEELGIDATIVSPSDLGCTYIHGTQIMIKQLFEKAEKRAAKNRKGVLLVFDEIDAMVPQRTGDSEGHRSGEVAEFLTKLNNSSQRGVYVIGTTNCLDRIDKAVMRKGRLDKVIYVGLPDSQARTQLFEYELSKRRADAGIDLEHLSQMTDGFTASDIAYIVNESARQTFAQVLSTSNNQLCIAQATIEDVIAKTRPSVTTADLRHYEEIRDQYADGRDHRRPHVGFVN